MTQLEASMFEFGWKIQVLGVFLGATVLFIWHGRREKHLLTRIPGPPGLPIIGCLFDFFIPREKLLAMGVEMNQKYGPVMYCNAIGMNIVMVSDPEAVKAVLSSRHNLTKDSSYNLLKPWLGSGLLTSPGSKWRSQRRTLDPAFHSNILENFIQVFNKNSAILVAELEKHSTKDYIEINDYITLCTLDNICETAMGTSVNAQKGEGGDYVNGVKRISALFVDRYFYPWLRPDFIFDRTSKGKLQKEIIEILQDFCTKVLQKKTLEYQEKKSQDRNAYNASERRRLSILDMLLELSDNGNKLSAEDIRNEVNTFLFAGHDTTASALTFAFFALGCHEDVQDKVVKEQREIFENDHRMPTMADLNRMIYLEKVIKEVLRMYPSVPFFSRIIETPMMIGQYKIPAGVNVMICAHSLHHNPDVYPDPEKFDPERFSPEQSAERHPYAYIPFSTGPRNCIGQRFARLEMMSVLSSVLRAFRIKTLEQEHVQIIPDIVLKTKQPLKVQISPQM